MNGCVWTVTKQLLVLPILPKINFGAIVGVGLPDEGATVEKGSELADLDSMKTARSDFRTYKRKDCKSQYGIGKPT